MPKMIDLTGRRYGHLVVIGLHDRQQSGARRNLRWLCQCDCGKQAVVIGHNLRIGNTKSCGCRRNQMQSKSLKEAWRIIKEEERGQIDGGAHCRP